MIDERELTSLVAQAARAHGVPEHGAQAIRAAAGAPAVRRRRAAERPTRRLLLAAVVVFLVLGAVMLAGGGGHSSNLAEQRSSRPLSEAGVAAPASPAPTRHDAKIPPTTIALPQAVVGTGDSAPDQRVVRTGEVELEVARGRFGAVLDRLSALATGRGGFVTETATSEQKAPSGTVTLRVPTREFDGAVSEIRRLGTVVAASSRGQDVTAQYTDLEARLKALDATRDQVLLVLGKAQSIGDILAVQQRLDAVQTQIEQLQGQQKVLGDQSTFGTIAVSVAERRAGTRPAGPPSGLARAWDDARHGFASGVESILAGSGTALVVLLCLAALAAATRLVVAVIRRRLV